MKNRSTLALRVAGFTFLLVSNLNGIAGVPSVDSVVNGLRNSFSDSNPLQFPDLSEGRTWNCTQYEATGNVSQTTDLSPVSFAFLNAQIVQTSNGTVNRIYDLENGERVAHDLASGRSFVLRTPEDGQLIIEESAHSDDVTATDVVDAIGIYGNVAIAYVNCTL